MPTWRTLTNKKKFALVYFEIDNTYAVVQTKKLKSDVQIEKGSEVDVKCGAVSYKAKIIELDDVEEVLEKKLLEEVGTGEEHQEDDDAEDEQQYCSDEQQEPSQPELPRTTRKRKRKAAKSPAKSKKKEATLLCSGDGPDEIPPNSSTPAPPDTDTTLPASLSPLSPLNMYVPSPPYASSLPTHSPQPSPSPQLPPQPTPSLHRSPRVVRRVQRQLFMTATTTSTTDNETTSLLRQILHNQQLILNRLESSTVSESYINDTLTFPLPTVPTLPRLGTNEAETELDDREIYEQMFLKSSSSGHFASLLVKHFFNQEERVNKNCMGKRGKEALDPVRLEKIRKIVLTYYCSESRNDKEQFWKNCVTRIDEFLRRKRTN